MRFTDITAASGVSSFTHVSGGAAKDYIIEATGSGVALWDFDNDGLLDIYLVNGGTLDALRRGAPMPRAALFRKLGRGTFRDVTAAAGVANERWGQGVCAGDFDNDGDQDLYVTNFGKNRLYRNAGGRTFEDIAVEGWRGRRQLVHRLRVRRLRRGRVARSVRGGLRHARCEEPAARAIREGRCGDRARRRPRTQPPASRRSRRRPASARRFRPARRSAGIAASR